MQWSDVQLLVPLASCKIQGFIVNGGSASSKGAELEGSAHILDGFDVTLSAAYTDAQLTQASPILGAPKGTALLFVPTWSFTGTAQYEFPIGGDLMGYLNSTLRYEGKTNLDYTGTNQSDAYAQLDLRAGVNLPQSYGNWELAVFVQNVTNAAPVLSRDPRIILPGVTVTSITPRLVGVNLRSDY